MSQSPAFQKAMAFILPHENEYARGHWGDARFVIPECVPGDAGGLTKYGLDARSHPGVDIANLTQDQAISIYYDEWLKYRLDLLPERLAIAAFDVYVNGGFPGLWLQQAYNKTHPLLSPKLSEDGVLGPKSLTALACCDQSAILVQFMRERDQRFQMLARSPSRSKFLDGWLQRDKDLLRLLEN